jgi:hypothetical protein
MTGDMFVRWWGRTRTLRSYRRIVGAGNRRHVLDFSTCRQSGNQPPLQKIASIIERVGTYGRNAVVAPTTDPFRGIVDIGGGRWVLSMISRRIQSCESLRRAGNRDGSEGIDRGDGPRGTLRVRRG